MRALELDFQRAPGPSRCGWALLAAALATLAALAASDYRIAQESAQQLAARQRIEAAMPDTSAQAPDPAKEAALAADRKALEPAGLPWDALFAALETADDADVAVLALTPDGARRQVKIHAEARHLGAMLAYHRRLQQDAGLRRVALLEHETTRDGAGAPVRFQLLASVGEQHGHP